MTPAEINGFTAIEITLLECAIKRAWEITRERDPFRDLSDDRGLRSVLTRRIITLYSSGVRDPDLLLELAVRC
jgi:hypothetical protein